METGQCGGKKRKRLRIAMLGAGEIIRGCHNRDKGTVEKKRLHDLTFIFSYPENEQNIFLDGWKAARKDISTKRAG